MCNAWFWAASSSVEKTSFAKIPGGPCLVSYVIYRIDPKRGRERRRGTGHVERLAAAIAARNQHAQLGQPGGPAGTGDIGPGAPRLGHGRLHGLPPSPAQARPVRIAQIDRALGTTWRRGIRAGFRGNRHHRSHRSVERELREGQRLERALTPAGARGGPHRHLGQPRPPGIGLTPLRAVHRGRGSRRRGGARWRRHVEPGARGQPEVMRGGRDIHQAVAGWRSDRCPCAATIERKRKLPAQRQPGCRAARRTDHPVRLQIADAHFRSMARGNGQQDVREQDE